MELSVNSLVVENCGFTILIIFVSSFFLLYFSLFRRRASGGKSCERKFVNEDCQRKDRKNLTRNKMSSTYSPSMTYSLVSGNPDFSRRTRSAGLITSYPCSSPRSHIPDRPTSVGREEVDTGTNLHLEKLQIGSPEKQPPWSRSVSPHSPYSSPVMLNTSYMRGDHLMPLWKDYPMVQKVVPSSYSYCSNPLSSYPNSGYGSPMYGSNYRSSSMATIFGGPKPLISPPKLDVAFMTRTEMHLPASPAYSCHSGHGRHSWSYGLPLENPMSPYLSSPLSRSSSQSSGFISQKEQNTPPPSSLLSPNLNSNDEPVTSVFLGQTGSDLHTPSGGSFLTTEEFASFSSLNSCGGASGTNLRRGRIWSTSSAFANVKSTAGNSKGNTCSRFARKDSDEDSYMRRLNDTRSVNSLYSEDEDDDESFMSAVTSLTKRTTKSSRPASVEANRFVRSKSKIRAGPYIRNLSSDSMFQDSSLKEDNESENVTETGYSVWSTVRQLFWSLSLLLNIVLMFWLFFGSAYDPQEAHWLHHLVHNIMNSVLTHVIITWESLQGSVFEILAAREVSGSSPMVVNNYDNFNS